MGNMYISMQHLVPSFQGTKVTVVIGDVPFQYWSLSVAPFNEAIGNVVQSCRVL